MGHAMKPMTFKIIGIFLLILALGIFIHWGPHEAFLNTSQIRWLHWMTFYACLITMGIVFFAIFYHLYRFRRLSPAEKKHFHSRFSMEVLWTLVPFLILALLLMPVIFYFIQRATKGF